VRIAYLGTPQMAVPPLEALHRAGHEVVLVVSNPDRRRGRGSATSPSPVKAAALELGLTVTDDLDRVASVDAELGVVVAYGRIIPVRLLDALAMVNLHFSLLPRWRGAAPVERAILAGDEVTGVCVMDVAEGLDTGGVHACAEVPIGPQDTAEELRGRLVEAGTDLLVRTLADGLGVARPQAQDGVTYAEKLRAEDRHLDWERTAEELHRVVRVGGAWTTFRDKRLKVLAATRASEAPGGAPGELVADTVVRCGDGALQLLEVQPEGRAPMAAEAWANGARPAGERLGR
jgi:methionyl-tRNA formyltransferase